MTRLRALADPWLPVLRRVLRPSRIGIFDTVPVSAEWGFDRGTPIDRYYIGRFLEAHAADVRGRVLEVKSSDYTRRFDRGVVRADVLDIDPKNEQATIVADLTAADHVPAGLFDCFILTQTLQFIYDAPAAVRHAHRLLAPGGALLATVPVVSRRAIGPDSTRAIAQVRIGSWIARTTTIAESALRRRAYGRVMA